MSKPKPVAERLVCSECDLDWHLHPENPRRRDCIELLKEHHGRVINPDLMKYVPTYSSTFVDPSNVITFTQPDDDDPDMGVPAKVS